MTEKSNAMALNMVGEKVKKILLVDDDLDDRELFIEAFSFIHEKSQVSALEGSDRLIEYLKGLSVLPDYLFLDLNMPRKGGKECLKEIQQHEELKPIKVVIYSTSLNPRDVAETYLNGAFCFIQKPSSFSDLKHLLHKVIETQARSYSLEAGFIISDK
jgi:DNA-binding NtrC family response regulator